MFCVACRIWGDHGQLAVSTAKVCLIGCTATGTELMKNLILPGMVLRFLVIVAATSCAPAPSGVGSYTLVDGKLVDGTDVGSNFFLTKVCCPRQLVHTWMPLLKMGTVWYSGVDRQVKSAAGG